MDTWVAWLIDKWIVLGGKAEDEKKALALVSALIFELRADGWFLNSKTLPEILYHIHVEIDKENKEELHLT